MLWFHIAQVGEVPAVRAVVDQLVGAGCWGEGMEPTGAGDGRGERADCLVTLNAQQGFCVLESS